MLIAIDGSVLAGDHSEWVVINDGYFASLGPKARARVEATFGPLDVFAFAVFAVLLIAAVVIVVSLGRLPGQFARRWDHPQAAAIDVAGWMDIATGGLLWPLAVIWAFTAPSRGVSANVENDNRKRNSAETDSRVRPEIATFQQSQIQVGDLSRSVRAVRSALEIASVQCQQGATNLTTVQLGLRLASDRVIGALPEMAPR